MKGAHELRGDTAQKIKTVELTARGRDTRTKRTIRSEVWEADIRRNKRLTGAL